MTIEGSRMSTVDYWGPLMRMKNHNSNLVLRAGLIPESEEGPSDHSKGCASPHGAGSMAPMVGEQLSAEKGSRLLYPHPQEANAVCVVGLWGGTVPQTWSGRAPSKEVKAGPKREK